MNSSILYLTHLESVWYGSDFNLKNVFFFLKKKESILQNFRNIFKNLKNHFSVKKSLIASSRETLDK